MATEYSELGERMDGGGRGGGQHGNEGEEGAQDIPWASSLNSWRMGMSFLRKKDGGESRLRGVQVF